MTADELHQILRDSAIVNNVVVSVIAPDGMLLMWATSSIVSFSSGNGAQSYHMASAVEIYEEGARPASDPVGFTITDELIDHINRVDGATEMTWAVDCQDVYYVVLTTGITIRIEI